MMIWEHTWDRNERLSPLARKYNYDLEDYS